MDATGQVTRRIDQTTGLQQNDVNAVYQGSGGTLWLALNAGITYVNLNPAVTVDSTAAGADTTVALSGFTAIIRKSEGAFDDSVIFGGTYGERVGSVQQLDQAALNFAVFPYDYNAFRFTFASNHYDEPEKVEYNVHLLGMELDSKVDRWSTRNYREYTNLNPGHYTFQVKARTPQGQVSQEATYSFRIKPPWHQSWWFVVFQIFFILGLLILSAVLEYRGRALGVSDGLIIFAILVVFEYINLVLEPVIGEYSKGIVFFQICTMALLAFMLIPVDKFLYMLLRRFTHRNDEKNDGEAELPNRSERR